MLELRVPSIEEGVLQVCRAERRVSKVVVDARSSSFLAFNRVNGYGPVDLRPGERGKLGEFAAVVGATCDVARTERFYSGVYRDMIRLVDPEVVVEFAGGDSAVPPAAAPGAIAPRNTTARSLVAFGDSFTAGKELDEMELRRKDPVYCTERAFPRRLAAELGLDYGANLAENGAGNYRILRNLCDFVARVRDRLSEYFFVIGLTDPLRKVFVLKDGKLRNYVNRLRWSPPRVLAWQCGELFSPEPGEDGHNRDLEHKLHVAAAFLRRIGAKFLVFPTWDFVGSAEFFRDKADMSKEVALYFGAEQHAFGFAGVTWHLPRGQSSHPLSEGHAVFARELATVIRMRQLL